MNEIEIEIKDKKKTIVGISIGVVSLLIMVIGATYAYWNAKGIVNFNTSTISYETEEKSLIILNGTSALLTLGTITGPDMKWSPNDVVYYAGEENKTTTPTEVTVGVATYGNTNDINTYRCQYTLTLTHGGTNDIIDKFLSNNYTNRSAGQIILTVNGEEYDLNDGFPSTVTGYLNVYKNQDAPINVGLKFVNLSDVDQDYLVNTNGYININVASNGFNCESLGVIEETYWTWEYNSNYDPTYSDTAQHIVDDYHDLVPYDVLRYNYLQRIGNYDIDNDLSLESCQTALSNFEGLGYDGTGTATCVNNLYWFEYVSYEATKYDTESDCVSNNPDDTCVYDNSTSKWLAYTLARYAFPATTESDCLNSLGGSYYRRRCVLNNTRYAIEYTSNDFEYYESPSACQEDLENYTSSQHAICDKMQPDVFIKNTKSSFTASANDNVYTTYYRKGNYQSLSACQNALEEPEEECGIFDNYYRLKYTNTSWERFDRELDCTNIIHYLSNEYNSPFCVYNSNTNKYIIYDYSSDIYTLDMCESMVLTAGEGIYATCEAHNYTGVFTNDYLRAYGQFNSESDCSNYLLNNLQSGDDLTCTYDNDLEKYIIYGIVRDLSQSQCQNMIHGLNGEGNCTIAEPTYAIKYPVANMPSYINRNLCLKNLQNYSSSNYPLCDTKYEIGQEGYKETVEICGIINDNLLCYSPFITFNEYKTLMDDFDGWYSCDTHEVYHDGYINGYSYDCLSKDSFYYEFNFSIANSVNGFYFYDTGYEEPRTGIETTENGVYCVYSSIYDLYCIANNY